MKLKNVTKNTVFVQDTAGQMITFVPPYEVVDIREEEHVDLDSIRSKVYVVESRLDREFFS